MVINPTRTPFEEEVYNKQTLYSGKSGMFAVSITCGGNILLIPWMNFLLRSMALREFPAWNWTEPEALPEGRFFFDFALFFPHFISLNSK